MAKRRLGEPYFNENREYESLLHKFRVDKGMTIKELVKVTGVQQVDISALANGTLSPLYQNGEIRQSAYIVCGVLGATPAELFPRYFCDINRHKEGYNDILPYDTYSENIARSNDVILEKAEIIRFLITHAKLSKLEKLILFYRFNEDMTLEEIGKETKRSKERIRQIISRAIRNLQRTAIREAVL